MPLHRIHSSDNTKDLDDPNAYLLWRMLMDCNKVRKGKGNDALVKKKLAAL